MKIHNYSGDEFEVEIDKENTVAVVKIEVTGDEIIGVFCKDGHEEWYNAYKKISNKYRTGQDYINDYKFVPKEEW